MAHKKMKTALSKRRSGFSKAQLGLFMIAFSVIGGYAIFKSSAASLATVTVTNTLEGTIQTQLSTNNVWSGMVDQAPGGQVKLNALKAPYVRIHAGDDGGDPAMPELKQNQWANTSIASANVEPRPFYNMDTLVNNVYASGQEPVMNIKFAPDWMWSCYPNSLGINGTQGTGSVSDLTFNAYAQYMARIVDYYNNGSMVTEQGTTITNPSGTAHKITYWELWNEPDLNNETPCAPSNGFGLTYQQYTTMWNAVTAAMLAKDPSLKFVGPATAGSQFGSSTTTGNQYVDYLMSNSVTKPTALSFHGYGYWDNTVTDKWIFDGDASEAGCCGGITDLVNGINSIRASYPALPIWLTEVNVNADWGNDANKRPSSEFAAAWWASAFAKTAPIGAGIIHQYDVADSRQFGLIDDQSGNPYIAYYVFQLLNQAFPQGSTILTSSSNVGNVQSLTVRRPDGHISVMVVNRQLVNNTVKSGCGVGGVPVTVTLSLNGITPASATLQQIDKNNVNCTSNAASAPAVQALNVAQPLTATFPGYGVAVFDITTAATGSTANLWVDTTGGTCTRSATPAAYSDAAACGSFDAAWDAASAGDTIRVKNGSYGIQHVSGDKTSETFIIGESKAGVTVSGPDQDCYNSFGVSTEFCAEANHMTLEDVTINAGTNENRAVGSLIVADDVTYRNVDVLGDFPDMYINDSGNGGNRFHWDGGTWGNPNPPARGCGANGFAGGEPVWVEGADDVIIEGVTFNKQTVQLTGACAPPNNSHLEFLRLEDNTDNFTLRDNIYMPGSDSGSGYIFMSVTTNNNMKIIGNYFADNGGSTWAQVSNPCDWTVAYNTFDPSGDDGAVFACDTITWVGNLGPASAYPGCFGTHTKNVWGGSGSCGSDTFVGATSLGVDASGHLQAGSPAIDAAEVAGASDLCTDSAYLNSSDIDGNTRPQSSACDAGADESSLAGGGTTKPGDINSDGFVNITDLSIILSNWGTTNSSCDLNTNGTVDIFDLSILLSNYGT